MAYFRYMLEYFMYILLTNYRHLIYIGIKKKYIYIYIYIHILINSTLHCFAHNLE